MSAASLYISSSSPEKFMRYFIPPVIAGLFCFGSSLDAAPLTEDDKTAMLDAIEKLKTEEAPALGQRTALAATALRKAVTSDDAALQLYLKCVEEHLFERQHRKSNEFREWKARNKAEYRSDEFQRALRHRYNWLLLTLEANQLPPDQRAETLDKKASEAMVALTTDAPLLARYRKMLEQSVLEDLVSQTYGLTKLPIGQEDPKDQKPQNDNDRVVTRWPLAPVPIGKVFAQVIHPPLHEKQDFEVLRSSWNTRLKCERLFSEAMIFGDVEEDDREPNATFDVFVTEEQPRLVWAMHIDLYRAGDEREAVLPLFEHIKENLSHPDAPLWLAELERMMREQPNS